LQTPLWRGDNTSVWWNLTVGVLSSPNPDGVGMTGDVTYFLLCIIGLAAALHGFEGIIHFN
jgi:hypothetical protein